MAPPESSVRHESKEGPFSLLKPQVQILLIVKGVIG